MARSMPKQVPAESKQDYQTPQEFFDAVVRTFGPLGVDLAASDGRLCPVWLGPGSAIADDSLAAPWATILKEEKTGGWLNPPWARLRPWAAKCRVESAAGARLVGLTRSAFGSWYADEVEGNALTLICRPRIAFVGMTTGYPADCAIHLFGFGMRGLGTWQWKKPEKRRTKVARGLKPGKGRK